MSRYPIHDKRSKPHISWQLRIIFECLTTAIMSGDYVLKIILLCYIFTARQIMRRDIGNG